MELTAFNTMLGKSLCTLLLKIKMPNCLGFHTERPQVSAGIKDLKVMKTTQSAFVNFVNDEYRSLPDMEDRIFCTVVYTKWDYSSIDGLNFDRAWSEANIL